MSQPDSVFSHLVKLLQSIEDDLVLPLEAHDRANRGGYLSISRQVSCYVDYLGSLAYGGKGRTTSNAVQYMETYFVRANSVYSGKCQLMYDMWRHGTVHEHDAKVYVSPSREFRLGWMANNSSLGHNRKWHLACFCSESERGTYLWSINLFELVDELKSSVTEFIRDLESDPTALLLARENLQKLAKAVDLDDGAKGADLLTEAQAVVESRSGVVDATGSVVRTFESGADFDAFAPRWGR